MLTDTRPPRARLSRSSARNTSRNAASFGSIEMTASPRTASAAFAAMSAPARSSSCSGSGDLSQARTRCPALSRLAAMALPMRPVPRNPTSIVSFLAATGWGAGACRPFACGPRSIVAAAWSDHCASPVFGCQQVLEQDPGTLIEGAPCRWRSRDDNRIGTVCFTTGCAGDAGFGQGVLEGRRRRWGGGSLCRPSRRHRSSRGLPHRTPPGQEAHTRAGGNAAVGSRQDMSLPGVRLLRKFRSLFRCSNSAIDGTIGIENEPASCRFHSCRRGRGWLAHIAGGPPLPRN